MTVTTASSERETIRRHRSLGRRLGDEIRSIRLDANVSLAALGRAAGIDPAYLGRIERGVANPSIEVLIAIGVALGSDLSLRFFADAGPRIHDRFQAPMLDALVSILDRRWRVELEVPVQGRGHGVIDAVLGDDGAGIAVAVEVQSDLRRLEQQFRWAHEKAEVLADRRATPVSRLLVLRSTVRTRQLARRYGSLFGVEFPGNVAEAYAALTTPDAPWPGPTLLWAHLVGSAVTIMRRTPPGVSTGHR